MILQDILQDFNNLTELDELTETPGPTDLLFVEVGGVPKYIQYQNVHPDADLKKYFGQNLQTGVAYTLVLADAGKIVEMNNAAANILTIPANASVVFPINTRIDIVQGGAGLLSVAIIDDTLNGELVSFGQYKALSLWKKSATVWVVFGGTT